MHNFTSDASRPLQPTLATTADPDGGPIVLIVGDASTSLCRSGETRPFLEVGPIPDDVLGCTSSSSSSSSLLPAAVAPCEERAVLRLVARLREHVFDQNLIVILPVQASPEYKKRLVLFLFERLEVRTIVVLSDVVADTFGVGLREALVLHASLKTVSVGRVESGVTVKYAASSSVSLHHLLKSSAAARRENGNARKNTNSTIIPAGEEKNEREGKGVSAEKKDENDISSLLLRLSVNGSSSLSNSVDLLDETYRETLLSIFGEEVYQRVASRQEERSVEAKRRRRDDEKEKNTGTPAGSRPRGGEAMVRLITAIANDTLLPVIVTGEALRVAPLLRNFLEEIIHECNNARVRKKTSSCSSSSSSSSSVYSADSSASSTTDKSDRSRSSSCEDDGGLLRLQPLPLENFPWLLSLLGGSLVSQLSLSELSKLRISREDALSSKGALQATPHLTSERSEVQKKKKKTKLRQGAPVLTFYPSLLMLLRRWAGSVLRKRHRTRAGSVLAMQEMRKLALLEAASDKPVHGRGDTSSSLLSSSSSSAAVLPSSPTAGEETIFELLDKAVEVACDRLKVSGGGNHDSSTMRSTSSSSLLKATSLTHFLSECRRLRLEIGEARDVQNRRHLRETIRTFWANNADGALACCAFHGRDFGFVAGFGLVDDALHVSFPSLQLALHYLVREKSTCPCTSMVWALHYMARELNYLAKNGRQLSAPDSKQNHKKKMRKREDQMEVKHDDERCDDVVSDRGGIPALDMAAVTAEELGEFRRTLAALGIERLDLFFIHHGESGRALGSAEDALHALEFLTVVKVNDASASVQASIEAKRPRWCLSSDLYLVMTLFRHICRNSKGMKFTSVVHAFKLLRIFMPLLCHSLHSAPPPPSSPLSSSSSCMEQQPEKEEGKEKKGSDTHACFTPHADLDVVKTTSDGTAPLFNINRERRDWELRRDGVDRIVWELCAALQRKDDRFVNSFHFVQIMSTISRLPPCLLSRVPRSRRQTIQNFEVFNTRMKGAEVVNTSAEAEEAATTKSTRGGGGAQHSRRRDERTSESPEEVWEYLISKACIFIPGLTSDQRRRVCRDLRLAVQRRERYFASPARVEKQRSTTKLSVLEMLLLPLAHELSQYPKDYEAAMFDHPPGERRDGE